MNVNFTCEGTSLSAQLIWCHDANCSRHVAECPQKHTSRSKDVCYSNGSQGTTLEFGRITAEMISRRFYCHQLTPTVRNASQQVMLKLRKTGRLGSDSYVRRSVNVVFLQGVTVLGKKVKTVILNEENVTFTCKSTDSKVIWCYDPNCEQVLPPCPRNSSHRVSVCYSHVNGVNTLNLPPITTDMKTTYYCHKVTSSRSTIFKAVHLLISRKFFAQAFGTFISYFLVIYSCSN